MQGDEIRQELEALRQEVRGLSTSILNLRQDDMRKVFGDQFKPVLTERIARHYSQAPGALIESGESERPEEELIDLVDRTVTIFQQDGKGKALRFVDEFERSTVNNADQVRSNEFELQLIVQLRDYLDLSDTVFNQTVPEVPVVASARNRSPGRNLSPDEAERLLAPLSNAKRIQVMLVLSRESNSLAELCKELDLQKGHLQFHLKALLDVDYIRFDRKSRLYSISRRGMTVLEGVTILIESLSAE